MSDLQVVCMSILAILSLVVYETWAINTGIDKNFNPSSMLLLIFSPIILLLILGLILG